MTSIWYKYRVQRSKQRREGEGEIDNKDKSIDQSEQQYRFHEVVIIVHINMTSYTSNLEQYYSDPKPNNDNVYI